MVFIIILFLSLAALGITLVVLDRRYANHTHTGDDGWFDPPMEKLISETSLWTENMVRDTVRTLLRTLLHAYSHMNARFKMKSYIKRKLREYLYEHNRDGRGNISSFLRHVQKEKEITKNLDSNETL